MVKELKKLFRNFIIKSNPNPQLEIDAVAVSSNIIDNENHLLQSQRQQNNEHYNDSQIENIINNRLDSSQSIVPSRVNSLIDIHPILPSSPTTAVVGELSNVQNVYNFSNIDGLHIGNSMVIYSSNNNSNNRSNRNRNNVSPMNSRYQEQIATSNNTTNNSEKNQNKIKITTSIEMLFRSRDDVEESVLSELSEFVGKNYQKLMRNLGLTQAQIEIVELDYNSIGHKEIIFQLLLKWSEEFFENANYGKLSRNLWRCDCREGVVKLEQILSRNKARAELGKETENDEDEIEKVKCV